MKTLLISSEFPPGPGGIGQHAASLASALAQHKTVVVLAQQDYANAREVEKFKSALPKAVQLVPFTRRGGKFKPVFKIRQALRWVKENDVKEIIVTGQLPLIIGAFIKRRHPKLRVVGFVHGTEITFTGSLLSKITVWAYKKLDHIYAVSNFTKSLLHPSLNLEKVSVLPNGLDAETLERAAKAKTEPFATWVGSPKILTVGNVTPRKGQHRVLKALPEILKRFPEAHYHIVGLPTDREKIEVLAVQLDVAHAITIHGRLASRDELYRAYATADVFMMLSENQKNGDLEGFGIAILEANAFGVPAIGAVGCGIEDAISPESGVLVDGDDSSAISVAIEQLLASKTIKKQGVRKWAEKHNWNHLIQQMKQPSYEIG